MKYYKELSFHEQQKVLDNLQDLPLFQPFRDDAHSLLMQSKVHTFDEKLGMYTLAEAPDDNADT
jgi:hypothetical protein